MNQILKTEMPTTDLVVRSESVAVVSAETAQLGMDLINDLDAEIKAIKDAAEPHRVRTYAAYKGVLDEIKTQCEPRERAIKAIKGQIKHWRARESERARAEAAERARQVEAEAAEKRKLLADSLRASGMTKRAADAEAKESVETQILVAQASVTAASAPDIDGVKTRKRWIGDLTDLTGLLQEIIDGNLPASIIEVKQGELNKSAASWKATREFRGVRFRCVEEVVR